MLNTIKTVIGYLLTLIEKSTHFTLSKNSISGIYNYLKIRDTLTTSGQPTEKQFLLIRDSGYKAVINLAPDNSENSLSDEGLLLKNLGIDYVHIPVDFKKPSQNNFDEFSATLGRLNLNDTWIHCAANMRVSAFIYKYRCEVLFENPKEAKKDLEKIWVPIGVWKEFISRT